VVVPCDLHDFKNFLFYSMRHLRPAFAGVQAQIAAPVFDRFAPDARDLS
jgi:hypothetical protein